MMVSKVSYPKLHGVLSVPERSSKLGLWTIGHENSEEDVKTVYNDTAEIYEEMYAKMEYEGPSTGTGIFIEHLKRMLSKDCNILDLGAGTGMCGEILKNEGYSSLTAVDISEQMLEEAKKKNIYREVIQKDLNRDSLEELEGVFDAVICIGVFYYGQVESSALDKVVSVMKPGGILCFSIRTDLYDNDESGYKQKCDSLDKEGKWKLISSEKKILFGKMEQLAYYLVFQRCH